MKKITNEHIPKIPDYEKLSVWKLIGIPASIIYQIESTVNETNN